ncbi:hypothetical protein [Robertmurraya massiliosenegalensis]|nr:hypothetical protein [Robertmurraya massiliosenegalensis]
MKEKPNYFDGSAHNLGGSENKSQTIEFTEEVRATISANPFSFENDSE